MILLFFVLIQNAIYSFYPNHYLQFSSSFKDKISYEYKPNTIQYVSNRLINKSIQRISNPML